MKRDDQSSFYVREAVMCHFYSTIMILLKTVAAGLPESHRDNPSNPATFIS